MVQTRGGSFLCDVKYIVSSHKSYTTMIKFCRESKVVSLFQQAGDEAVANSLWQVMCQAPCVFISKKQPKQKFATVHKNKCF
jgi:hypothetical protein